MVHPILNNYLFSVSNNDFSYALILFWLWGNIWLIYCPKCQNYIREDQKIKIKKYFVKTLVNKTEGCFRVLTLHPHILVACLNFLYFPTNMNLKHTSYKHYDVFKPPKKAMEENMSYYGSRAGFSYLEDRLTNHQNKKSSNQSGILINFWYRINIYSTAEKQHKFELKLKQLGLETQYSTERKLLLELKLFTILGDRTFLK